MATEGQDKHSRWARIIGAVGAWLSAASALAIATMELVDALRGKGVDE
jgi:hypothetical protein